MAPHAFASIALVPAILLAGCILAGAPDDVALVCERKSTAPWHPYAPDEVKAMTLVEPGATLAGVNDATQAAARRILTLGARPYDAFEAHLFPFGDATWRFDANGTMGNATDRYVFDLREANGTLAPTSARVDAPASLVAIAAEAAARDPEAAAVLEGATPTRGEWSDERPSCVTLEHGESHITVNMVQRRVVHLS